MSVAVIVDTIRTLMAKRKPSIPAALKKGVKLRHIVAQISGSSLVEINDKIQEALATGNIVKLKNRFKLTAKGEGRAGCTASSIQTDVAVTKTVNFDQVLEVRQREAKEQGNFIDLTINDGASQIQEHNATEDTAPKTSGPNSKHIASPDRNITAPETPGSSSKRIASPDRQITATETSGPSSKRRRIAGPDEKQITPADARRRWQDGGGDLNIIFHLDKKRGESGKRYRLYSQGKTPNQCLSLGATSQDLTWDIQKGNASIITDPDIQKENPSIIIDPDIQKGNDTDLTNKHTKTTMTSSATSFEAMLDGIGGGLKERVWPLLNEQQITEMSMIEGLDIHMLYLIGIKLGDANMILKSVEKAKSACALLREDGNATESSSEGEEDASTSSSSSSESESSSSSSEGEEESSASSSSSSDSDSSSSSSEEEKEESGTRAGRALHTRFGQTLGTSDEEEGSSTSVSSSSSSDSESSSSSSSSDSESSSSSS